jgi:hypothetical protein
MSSSVMPPPESAQGEEPAEPTSEQIVTSPAVEGDLNTEMRRAAQPFSKATVVLAGLVVIAAAFAGGAWTHSAFGSTSSSAGTARQPGAGGPQAGNPSGTQGGTGTGAGGFRGAGRGTSGTVERVEGSTVYVKTAQGTEVKVSTSDSTTVGLTQPGKLADLKPGATVVVQGQPDQDGAVTAQAITQEPAR